MSGITSIQPKPGHYMVVICEAEGIVTIDEFRPGEFADALDYLDYRQSKRANWGKCFEVRESDGRYIFHKEFQQRFNL